MTYNDDEQPETLSENGGGENQQAPPELTLTGYCMKTKQKDVTILESVITRTSKGGYMASGNDGQGNKLTTLLGKEKAEACIAAGLAKKSWED